MKKKQVLDFREIRRMLWRRRLLIVVPITVTMAIATYQASTMPATYSSTTVLAPENPLPLTQQVAEAAGGGGKGGRRGGGSGGMNIRTRIMSSRFLESVAVQIGLNENPALRARAKVQVAETSGHDIDDLVLRQCVLRLRQMIKVNAGNGGVINITAVSTSPRLAQTVSTAVSEQYLHTIRQLRLSATEEATGFAREQLKIFDARLEEKQEELRKFQQRQAVKPLSSSPVSTGNLTRVNSQIAEARADAEAQRERQESVTRRIKDAGMEPYLGLGVLQDSDMVNALKETLFGLERSMALTLVEQPEGGPANAERQVQLQSQRLLQELEKLAGEQLPSLSEERQRLLVDHEFLQISIDAAEARADELRRFLDKYASDLASMPAAEIQERRLQEEVQTAERLRQTWVDQLNSTALAASVLSVEGVAEKLIVLEAALLPMRPFAPDRQRILLVALAMGVALGIGAAVITEYFDLTLKSVEEIEAVLEAPILGAVPKMQAAVVDQLEIRRKRRIWVFVSSSVFLVALVAAGWIFLNP